MRYSFTRPYAPSYISLPKVSFRGVSHLHLYLPLPSSSSSLAYLPTYLDLPPHPFVPPPLHHPSSLLSLLPQFETPSLSRIPSYAICVTLVALPLLFMGSGAVELVRHYCELLGAGLG
ncbi:hypothetical protein FALCPG4_002862 [Fusarium falciforme]